MEREELAVDVVFVGGGPASFAGAITLRRLAREAGRELSILVLEKAAEFGAHQLSGAVFDPRAFTELSSGTEWSSPPPLDAEITDDAMWFLHGKGKIKLPYTPPPLANHGKHILSLNRFIAWLAAEAQALDIDCFPAFPASELLWDGDSVVGVQIGDKGVGADGTPLPNYEPGPRILSKIVILGEGVRGTLAKTAIAKLALDAGKQPTVFALGIKELWQLPAGRFPAGNVIHTLGHPLPAETFGGGWLYGMKNDILDIGLVVGLDSPDPSTDAHDAFNRFKHHPAIAPLLHDAVPLSYGAKAIPEGGLYAQPRMYAAGLLMIGDSAGFVNGLRLKGIHLAMKSGMLAAEAAFAAFVADAFDAKQLAQYEALYTASWAHAEMHSARNFHQGFENGIYAGLINAALGIVSGGRGFGVADELIGHSGPERLMPVTVRTPRAEQHRLQPDGVISFDKLTNVYRSGTRHDESQPSHLHVSDTNICADKCTKEFGNPCQRFCPAQVYNPEFTVGAEGKVEGALRIDFANCVHCKTCDILDPYQIITWVPPQGGDGPAYANM